MARSRCVVPFFRYRFFAVVLALSLLNVAAARAQIVFDTTSQTTPVPGDGHDYFKMLGETVNPADGSVTLQINIPVPRARGITLPFGYTYSSNAISLQPTPVPGQMTFGYVMHYNNNLSSGAWSTTLPLFSATKISYLSPQPGSTTCFGATNFVFHDGVGGTHPLGLANVQTSYGSTVCPSGWTSTTSGGDDSVQAGGGGTGWPGPPILPAPAVVDADGTVYKSDGMLVTTDPQVPTGVGVFSTIEDRNGNIIRAVVPYPGFAPTSIEDSVGRTILSFSGGLFGSVTVPGVSQPYTLHTGNVSDSGVYINGTQLIPDGTYCNLGASYRFDALVDGSPFTSLTLPNNQQYQFSYDPVYGLLNQVTYPSGGYISYQWATNLQQVVGFPDSRGIANDCVFQYSRPALSKRFVSFDGTTAALEQDFQYSATWTSGSGYWTSRTTTVTTKDLIAGTTATTIYNYVPSVVPAAPDTTSPPVNYPIPQQVPLESVVTYEDSTGKVLRTVSKTWAGNVYYPNGDPSEPGCQTTTLDDGSASTVCYSWGPGHIITDKKEWDYGTPPSGTPTRETKTTYQAFAVTPTYPYAPSILDRPASVSTYGNGALAAQTVFTYDQGTIAGVSNLPSGTHDETNYGPTTTTPRGNATTVTRKCLNCTNATSTYTFDETGNALSMTDPCGNAVCSDMTGTSHTTTFSYSDSYTVLQSGSNVSYTPSGNTNTYLTKLTDPLGHQEKFTYDYNNGQLTISTDANTQPTTYLYNDPLARPTVITNADQGQTTYVYNDSPYNPSTPSPSVTKTEAISSGVSRVTTAAFDGAGHTVESILSSDPDGATYSATNYVGIGKPYKSWNPTRCSPPTTNCGQETTWGFTTYSYDALGRTIQVLDADGSKVLTTYSGNQTTVTDEVGAQRTSKNDAWGRLTTVFEAPASYNYETDYTYDALNNSLSVNQNGSRTRTFTYDSLSRLITATNPESGTISYGYDLNGNLTQKKSPKPNQTNPTTTSTVNFCYDVLNRVTSKAYNTSACPPSSPQATYTYDQGTNGIGRRTGMTDTAGSPGSATWTYDLMGRIASETRVTANVTKTTSYTYNQGGSVSSITYPSTRVVNYTYSRAGRVVSAIDPTGPIKYITSATYAPSGEVATAINGYVSGGFAGIDTANIYGPRLQPILLSASAGSTSVLSLCYDLHMKVSVNSSPCTFNANSVGDNGTVFQIVNKRDGNRTQNFIYDALNRIQQAYTNGPNWGETISSSATNPGTPPSTPGIDPWGNLTNRSGVTGKTYYEGLNCPANANNQLTGCSLVYDAAGNVTSDGSLTYTYDTEDRMTKYVASSTDLYFYDGDGNRVKKSVAGVVTLYWYGATGNVLDETRANGTLVSEYIFFDGKRVARRDADNSVKYYFSDNLGSASVVTNSNGAILSESDYYPYGGEIVITGADSNHYKFTGKERDGESGLDNFGARYFTSNLGRFMTPDWAARPTGVPYAVFGDPQSLNLYTYVRNDPVSRADADGHGSPSPSAWASGGRDITCSGTTSGGDASVCVYSSASILSNAENTATQESAAQQNTTPSAQKKKPPPKTTVNKDKHGGGAMVVVSGTATGGIVKTGATATGTAGVGGFYNSKDGVSVGAAASGAETAFSGTHSVGSPDQGSNPADRNSAGAFVGAGVGVLITNAGSAQDLKNTTHTFTADLGWGLGGSVGWSGGGGVWELQITIGVGYGGGYSFTQTATAATGGGQQ